MQDCQYSSSRSKHQHSSKSHTDYNRLVFDKFLWHQSSGLYFQLENPPFFPGDNKDLKYCEFQVDDIKVEHHPNSGIPTKVCVFSDFKHHPAHYSLWSTPEPDA
ncbi:hypothetical protein BDR06DRAFT_973906 [Suillus hirtellus]|nr:hypothetical protein BDR06DRAFT_973906 [Suillus hirtellus]